jgi:hypothetical protein
MSLIQSFLGWLRSKAPPSTTGGVQFGAQILDTFLAPGISSFNEVNVPDLTGECPQADHWISNLFLNSLFGPRYNETWKQAAVTFLFRTQTALRAYTAARARTLTCVENFQPGRPASKSYFEAVSQWEVVLLNIQIVLDLFFTIMDPQAVETDDAKRIRRAANRVKHFAEDIEQKKNSADLTLPMWLGKDGLITRTAEVSYEEIAENLREMAKAADLLQDPGGREQK